MAAPGAANARRSSARNGVYFQASLRGPGSPSRSTASSDARRAASPSNVAEGVNALRAPDRAFLVITHYQRLLDYIRPDVVHVLADGRIVETGGPELALELEAHGYAWIRDRVSPEARAWS